MVNSRYFSFLLVGLVGLAACSKTETDPALPAGDGAAPVDGAAPSKSSWEWHGADLASTYVNAAETMLTVDNAPTLAEAWTATSPGQVTSIPAVKDGKVFAVGYGGLTAYDPDGNVLWTSTVKGPSSPAIHDGTLYVNDGHSVLHALSAADGTELWKSTIDPNGNAMGYSSPIIFESLVIVGSTSGEEAFVKANATFRGGMVAFNKDTGKEVWRHATVKAPANGCSIWSSPSVDPEARVLFGATGNNYTEVESDTSDSIFALNVDTGEQLWNTQLTKGDVYTSLNQSSTDSDFGADPMLFEATINGAKVKIVGAGQKNGNFSALDRMTGKVLWQVNVSPSSALTGGILNNGAFDGEHILIVGNGGASTGPGSEDPNGESTMSAKARLMALDPADGTVVWERQLGAWAWGPITVANGVGFVPYGSHLQAFNTKTGEQLGSFGANGTVSGGASIVDGHVYFGSGLQYLTTKPDSTFHCLKLP